MKNCFNCNLFEVSGDIARCKGGFWECPVTGMAVEILRYCRNKCGAWELLKSLCGQRGAMTEW